MAIVMGIVTMIRMTRNMPRKITEAALYGSSGYYDGTMMKAATFSCNDYMAMMKRMAELEEKVTILSMKPVIPPEKEEVLNNALGRVTTLEQDLVATKKVYRFSFILQCHNIIEPLPFLYFNLAFYFDFRHLMMPLLDK